MRMHRKTMNSIKLNSKTSKWVAFFTTILLILIPTSGSLVTAAYADADPADTTLSAFTVNGTSVTNGSTYNAPFGSTSVTVVATPANPSATAVVTGATDLQIGNNTLTVSVTSADSSATSNNTVTIVVPEFNNDTSLSTFKIDGQNVADGDTITIAQGRTSVRSEEHTSELQSH